MQGAGSHAIARTIVLLGSTHTLKIATSQSHTSSDTHSDFKIVGSAQNSARYMHTGTITVAPDTHTITAHQKNQLFVRDCAQVLSKPCIDIHTNSIDCTHGAAFGPLCPSRLWYLNTYGINNDNGSYLIIHAFCMYIIMTMELPAFIQEHINSKITHIYKKISRQ